MAALGLGVALFIGSTAGIVWRVSGEILWLRLIVLAIGTIVFVFTVSKPPIFCLVVIAATLGLIVVGEEIRSPARRSNTTPQSTR